jgi:hypothetical protein
MDVHNKFTEWAIEKGVKINGIKPHRFEGRGLGIIAEKDLEVRRTWFHTVLLTAVQLSLKCSSSESFYILLYFSLSLLLSCFWLILSV